MTTPSATPTPITPPRVPFFDERSGLISREWYMFFLSMFRSAQIAVDSEQSGPSALSLISSLEQALDQLRQAAAVVPSESPGWEMPLDQLRQAAFTLPPPSPELLDELRQELRTQPRAELGTMAALQQSNVPWLTFDTTPPFTPTDVGTLAWDGGTTLGLQATANVLMELGETEYIYVKASAAITKGQLCYHTGSVGSSGVITAAPTPLGLLDPNQLVGVAAESIALNGFGLIQFSGPLRGFDTTGTSVGEVWADGDPLYYNPAYVGSLTKTRPSAPNQKSYIGEVINAGPGASGSIMIRMTMGSSLSGMNSDVQITSPANKDILQYDSALGYWKNVAGSSSATLPSAITVTASPFTYQNTTAYPVDVIVSGGGVSALAFTRDNVTFYDTGSYYGMFTLSPNDRLRVTYTAAPTMTLIPR